MKTFFKPTSCLTTADLRNYIARELSREERFRIENHLLDCALCSEALEGFRLAQHRSPAELEEELDALRSDLQNPTAENEVAG